MENNKHWIITRIAAAPLRSRLYEYKIKPKNLKKKKKNQAVAKRGK